MSAISERRTRRTIVAGAMAVVLAVAAAVLFGVGVVTLSNSRAGEAVGIDLRPRVALPSTPNALIAATDDDGRLTAVIVATLVPEGQGGSIVTVPVNADATAGFGMQRRPLNELFDAVDPDTLVAAVEDMLSITIERSAIVDPAGLEALLAPFDPLEVALPDIVVDSDADGADTESGSDETVPDATVPDETTPDASAPDDSTPDAVTEEAEVGVDGVIFTAGPQSLGPAEITDVLTAVDASVPAYDQHPLDVAVWSAIAATAPLPGSDVRPDTTDAAGVLVPPASVEELLVALFAGEVGVRDIAVSEPSAGTNPTDVDVVVLDRADAALVFAQISPALVSTPNTGSKMRIVGQFTDEQLATSDGLYESNSDLARVILGRLLFLQANIVSVDTEPTGAPELTVVEVTDPRLLEESITASEALFGPSEVRLATTVLEGVDIVVTLGESYLEREVAANIGAAGLEPEPTAPADTVETDG